MENTAHFNGLIKAFNSAYESNHAISFTEDEYEHLIEYFLTNNEPEKALYACEHAINFFPFSSDFFLSKAEAYMDIGEVDEAIDLLNSTYNIDKQDPMYYIILADLYVMNDETDRAINILHDGVGKCQNGVDEILSSLSDVYIFSEDYEMAIITLEEAILLNSIHIEKFPKYIYGRDLAKEKYDFVKQILDRDPMNASSWYVYGFLLNKLELYQESIEALEYSLALDDENQNAYEVLIHNYIALEKSDKVDSLTKEYLKKGLFSGIFLYLVGYYFYEVALYNRAQKYLNKALEDNVDVVHNLVYNKKFELNYVQGNYKACLDNLNRLETRGTAKHELYVKKILIYAELENQEKVKEYIDKAIQEEEFVMSMPECMTFLESLYNVYGMKETVRVFTEHSYFSRYKLLMGILMMDLDFEDYGLSIVEEEIEKYPYYSNFLLSYREGLYDTSYIRTLIDKFLD